jgi:hypothetical protein
MDRVGKHIGRIFRRELAVARRTVRIMRKDDLGADAAEDLEFPLPPGGEGTESRPGPNGSA